MKQPDSYVVIDGRAYALDENGTLQSCQDERDPIDFENAEPVIGTRLLAEPRIASGAGATIDHLRQLLRPLTSGNGSSDGSADQPAFTG